MKVMNGGWVWELPAEAEFVEVVDNGERIRMSLVLFDAAGEKIQTPSAHIVPAPEPWTRRVTA